MSQLYNDMLTTSRDTFRTLIKTYALAPPSDPGFAADVPLQMVGPTGAKIDRPTIKTTTATDARFRKSTVGEIGMRKISKANAAVYIDLNPYPLQTAPVQFGMEGGNT